MSLLFTTLLHNHISSIRVPLVESPWIWDAVSQEPPSESPCVLQGFQDVWKNTFHGTSIINEINTQTSHVQYRMEALVRMNIICEKVRYTRSRLITNDITHNIFNQQRILVYFLYYLLKVSNYILKII